MRSIRAPLPNGIAKYPTFTAAMEQLSQEDGTTALGEGQRQPTSPEVLNAEQNLQHCNKSEGRRRRQRKRYKSSSIAGIVQRKEIFKHINIEPTVSSFKVLSLHCWYKS